MQELTAAQKIMLADGFPMALFIAPAIRRAFWKGRKLTTPAATITRPKVEDPTTAKLRKELEASDAKKKAASLERLREYKAFQNRSAPKPELKPRAIMPTTRAIVPTQQEIDEMATSARKKISKTTQRAKSATKVTRGKKAAKAARTPAKPKPEAAAIGTKAVRPGSKLEKVVELLTREGGCTAAEVLKATEWPAVSMPQQARAAGLALRQEKEGKTTRYWGSTPKAA